VAEKVASQVIDLVETNINAPIVVDDNEIGDVVGNSFNEVIADFLPVTTSTQSIGPFSLIHIFYIFAHCIDTVRTVSSGNPKPTSSSFQSKEVHNFHET
jgi:hypothetical protein